MPCTFFFHCQTYVLEVLQLQLAEFYSFFGEVGLGFARYALRGPLHGSHQSCDKYEKGHLEAEYLQKPVSAESSGNHISATATNRVLWK